jgi:hypothetical protein
MRECFFVLFKFVVPFILFLLKCLYERTVLKSTLENCLKQMLFENETNTKLFLQEKETSKEIVFGVVVFVAIRHGRFTPNQIDC